jgi:hypothetical protein
MRSIFIWGVPTIDAIEMYAFSEMPIAWIAKLGMGFAAGLEALWPGGIPSDPELENQTCPV